VTADDRSRWDERYRRSQIADGRGRPRCPAAFEGLEAHFPDRGDALDLACGQGAGSVWLAQRGMRVTGVDVSPVAIESARDSAATHGVADLCDFEVFDLDETLPRASEYDLIMCHMFRARSLNTAIVEQLKLGGLLAIAVLSEVGGTAGRFREPAGALKRSFARLDAVAHAEGGGRAVLLARKPLLSPGNVRP